VSTLFPGSGSTRGTPPKLVGGGGPTPPSGPTWSVEYELDFTAQGQTVNLGTNLDTPTIDGKTWTVQHQWGPGANPYCTSIDLVAGVGLQIDFTVPSVPPVPPLIDSYQDPGTNSAPRIEIPVSSLVPGLADGDVIAFQILAGSSGLNDDWQSYGVMLGDGPTGDNWIENATVFWSGGGGAPTTLGNDVQMGNTGRELTAIGVEPSFREIVWYVGSWGFGAGADTSSSLIEPLTSSAMEAESQTIPGQVAPAPTMPLNITAASAKLSLHAYYNDAATSNPGSPSHSFTATWTKLRVLKMN